MRNQVQLIAYADRLGGSLPGLLDVLHGPLAGLFGGIHVLPFYRPYDGADAGFDERPYAESVVARTTADPHWITFGDGDLVRRAVRSARKARTSCSTALATAKRSKP